MLGKKFGVASALVVSVVLGFAAMASAAASTPDAAIEAGAESLRDSLFAVAIIVLPLAAAVAAIPIGWKWVRKFIK